MVDFVYADGCEADGRGDAVSEDGGASVPGVGVDEHAWDYAVAVEGLPVYGVRVGLAGVGGSVVPPVLGELVLCEGFESGGVWGVLVDMRGMR